MSDLILPVETFVPEAIRHRQRLAQAVCLQFSTTSIVWKLLALWNSLRSATLTVAVGPFCWWLKDNTMEALKFVLHFVLPACSHFVLYTSLLIHFFSLIYLSRTVPYHACMLQLFVSLCFPISRYIQLYFFRPRKLRVRCHNFNVVRKTN